MLILTVYDDSQYVDALLDAGAAGYLLKTIEIEELTRAITGVLAGESVLDPAVSRAALSRLARTQVPGGGGSPPEEPPTNRSPVCSP